MPKRLSAWIRFGVWASLFVVDEQNGMSKSCSRFTNPLVEDAETISLLDNATPELICTPNETPKFSTVTMARWFEDCGALMMNSTCGSQTNRVRMIVEEDTQNFGHFSKSDCRHSSLSLS